MEEGIITRDQFPPALLEWDGAPDCLWFQGNRTLLGSGTLVSVVGTRNPSREGAQRTKKLVQTLVAKGVTVVSGMAKGVDYIAHTTALGLRGSTIAVMGTPIEGCYPREHEELKGLIASSGLVLSQFEPQSSPKRYNFPKRNETMAAMSIMTIVTEATATSGTRHQVAAAIKLGRRVGFLASLVSQKVPWIEEALQSECCFIVESPSQIANEFGGSQNTPSMMMDALKAAAHSEPIAPDGSLVQQALPFDEPLLESPPVEQAKAEPTQPREALETNAESPSQTGFVSWIRGMLGWVYGDNDRNRRRK